jgi:Tfp pilus assembly protein PilF
LSLLTALLLTAIWAQNPQPSAADQLAQHRNLGKAFYENPTTQAESVAEFKKALDLAPNSAREKLNYGLALMRDNKGAEGAALLVEVQKMDPKLPHTWFNLGIYYKKVITDDDKAIEQFEGMAKLTPDEPIVHYQLGTLYKLSNKPPEALAQFELAAKLDPRLAAARFQLYNMYRQIGRTEDAAAAFATFNQLKKAAEGAAVPEDVDWCNYAEVYDPPVPITPEPVVAAADLQDKVVDGAAADAKTAGMLPIDSQGNGQVDLLVWSSSGIHLLRNGASGMTRVSDSGLPAGAVISVAAGDFDNDGLTDLCILTEAGPQLYKNGKGKFSKFTASLPQHPFERAVFVDYDHDYDLDLVLFGDSPALLRNEGKAGFADRTADFPFEKGKAIDVARVRVTPDSKSFDLAVFYSDHAPVAYLDQLGGKYTKGAYSGAKPDASAASADFDNDGRGDTARIAEDGKIHVVFNKTKSPSRWVRVKLEGVKNLKLAQDAEVEIKSASVFHKQLYPGYPVVFDVSAGPTVDTIRITWPNGLIQNEINKQSNQTQAIKEAQRLSGSCPMIWTWNGRGMQFITDVLGVAPLGASDGEGSYFPVDHDEYVSIPGSALQAVDGQYDIRVTEELSEVSYLDQIQLVAVDHPAGSEIFTNEKFKGPPYPEHRLFSIEKRVYPNSASDDEGHNILSRIQVRDRQYPDQFGRTPLGVAKTHAIELDFTGAAPSGKAVLLLNGWVDWPDGSTFRAASQEIKGGLLMPYLQMQDANGQWKTVNEDMGMPAGKPKTIAVDLQFPSNSRKIRIVTNLCVYWDEIFLSEEAARPAQAQQRELALASADLHFRGFSAARIHPERKQPDTFTYDRPAPTSFWNPTPGMYTRYGDVRELIGQVDDRLALLGSGDEMLLRFDARSLPAPPAGWKRDFLLKVDGWAKDRDPNTAFGGTVDPLPFHGMSRYPYPATEHFPADALHQKYRAEYNTRPALRLLRRLSTE